jgi:hypothetical protein
MKFAAFLILIMFIEYGCEKKEPVSYSTSLVGEWSWLITCGGFAGCTTPATSNLTMRLVFTEDSLFYDYVNDTLRLSGRYFTYDSVGPFQDHLDIIKMGKTLQQAYQIHNDTLELTSVVFYAGSTWKRIR